MPTPARDSSFWACDVCGVQGFSSFEHSKQHEIECRARQQQQHPPAFSMPPSETQAPLHKVRRDGTIPTKMNRIPLLAPGEHPGSMDATDIAACQSLEFFEATHDQQLAEQGALGSTAPIALGQVGIRCTYCMPGAVAYNTIYPESIADLQRCVHVLSDHLASCSAAPENIRTSCIKGAALRQRNSSQDEECRDRELALVGRCRYLASSLGLTDNARPKMGISFANSAFQPMDAHIEPISHRDPTMHPEYSASPFISTPYATQHPGGGMMDIAATPLARRFKPSFDPNGAPISARRDHLPPPSADRRGLAATAANQRDVHAFLPTPGSATRTPYSVDSHRPSHLLGPDEPLDHRGPPQESPQVGYAALPQGYEMHPPLEGFPYVQHANGTWSCRYCDHLHPAYRGGGALWNVPNPAPPPSNFIDHHLSICMEYNQSLSGGYFAPHPFSTYDQPIGQFGGQYAEASHGPPGLHQQSWMHPPPASQPYPPPLPAPYTYQGPVDGEAFHCSNPLMPVESSAVATQYKPPQKSRSRGGRSAARVSMEPVGNLPSEGEILKAVDTLIASDRDCFGTELEERKERGQLVQEDDKLMLTDYFFHLMRQLRHCLFVEDDRKTRGGKRLGVPIGFGGLQCVHCSGKPNGRKFFWSNVDRIANSFAEIPAHILKCRHCPQEVKHALIELKKTHSEQMGKLPRGSQKIFFRRMWRRIHPIGSPRKETRPTPEKKLPETDPYDIQGNRLILSPGTSSDDSAFIIERSTADAAKTLMESVSIAEPLSPSSRVLLSISEDKEWLSDMDCFVRRNVEVFCATKQDSTLATQDGKYPVCVGQVGIRCIHCALAKDGPARGAAVAYPYSISGIYESVREFQRLHLESCVNLPKASQEMLGSLKGSSSLTSVLRKYYILAAHALGMTDTPEGIRSNGKSTPLESSAVAAFSFPESATTAAGARGTSSSLGGGDFLGMTPSRKRKAANSNEEE